MLRDNQLTGYGAAVGAVAGATLFLYLLREHINQLTIGLTLLLVVLFVATAWGPRPGIVSALLGVVCLNFFFLPPLHTFTIADPENWTALVVFLITAITVGQLSARARQRAAEANVARAEIERLYHELQDSFEKASQAKALQQSERLKAALLDAVTHDLRTPLTSIKASITTLLDDARGNTNDDDETLLDAKSRIEMLEVVDEESDRLTRFINGLIELARIEAGELQLRRHWSGVEEIIGATLQRAKPITRQHEVLVQIEKDLPTLRVDERAVSEVLYTLIDNAAKYSPAGTTLRVAARRAESVIQMSVEDSGVGIPIELRSRVFDKFFRASDVGSVKGSRPAGTGMGLAIAKGIVDAHDGRIWIEDAGSQMGTRVVFTLPIGDGDADSIASEILINDEG